MRKLFMVTLAAIAILGAPPSLVAADAVEPATLALVHCRDEGTLSASSTTFWRGDTILLTNCVVYNATTTNGSVQGLSGVGVFLRVGNTDSATSYVATVQDAAAGKYWCSITCPTSGTVYIQTTISNVVTYTYGWKLVSATSKL